MKKHKHNNNPPNAPSFIYIINPMLKNAENDNHQDKAQLGAILFLFVYYLNKLCMAETVKNRHRDKEVAKKKNFLILIFFNKFTKKECACHEFKSYPKNSVFFFILFSPLKIRDAWP